MNPQHEIKLPPPIRQTKQSLSLQKAMKAMDKNGKPIRLESKKRSSILSLTQEMPLLRSGQAQEKEAYLLELEAEIFRREEALTDKEIRLAALERELNEKDALLEARIKVMETSSDRSISNSSSGHYSSEEFDALKRLKIELDAQEAALKQSRKDLQAREEYVEECENTLVTKSTELTEREAALEQLEDDKRYDAAQ